MDREQKILLLKGLQAGTISVQDLQPKSLCHSIGFKEGSTYETESKLYVNNKLVDNDTFMAELKRQEVLHGPIRFKVNYVDDHGHVVNPNNNTEDEDDND